MIKAIIFDCFGVLATDGWLPYKHRYFGHDKALFQEATDLQRPVDAGLEDYDNFLHVIAARAGVSYEETKKQIENNIPNDELFDYIHTNLKSRYKLGMLSNAGDNWLDEMFMPEQVKLFDAVALSYETGFVKPDSRAYQLIANRLGVEPEECIFVDDVELYVTAAEVAGMQGIRYKYFEQMQSELEAMLAANPDN